MYELFIIIVACRNDAALSRCECGLTGILGTCRNYRLCGRGRTYDYNVCLR